MAVKFNLVSKEIKMILKWQNKRTSVDHFVVTGQGVLSDCGWIIFRVPTL